MENNPKWSINIWREEGDSNMGLYMTLGGEEFNWHSGSEEDKQVFREMLNGFAGLFNRC